MNRKIFALVLLVGGILFFVFWKSSTSTDHPTGDRGGSGSGQSSKAGGGDEVTGAEGASESAPPEASPRFAAGAIDEFHKYYGDPSRRPIDDLDLLNSLFYLYVSNFKNPDDIPTEGNQAIYRALRGENPDKFVFIRKDFPFVNDQGEILDRWGKPLYFHFYHPRSPGIISGGEDGQLWTEDDVKLGK